MRSLTMSSRAAELVSLKEVREALQLAEWRSASGDNKVQGVENRLRVELMTRLVEGYRQTLKSSDRSNSRFSRFSCATL